MGLVNNNVMKSTRTDEYTFTQNITSNNTSSPTTVSPDYGTDVVTARTGTGAFTTTFAERKRPLAMHHGSIHILGDEPNISAKVISYTPSTGVLVWKSYTNSAGTVAAADSTSKVYQLKCIFTRSSFDS